MRSDGDPYIDDGWAQVGVQGALCGMKAQALRDVPEAAVISEHAGELCEQGRAESTFQGLYVIYQNNIARWETEWDYQRIGQPGSGGTVRDEIELEAPPVEQLHEALRFEREQSVEHSYIRAAVLDKVNVLHALKLPVETLLK